MIFSFKDYKDPKNFYEILTFLFQYRIFHIL